MSFLNEILEDAYRGSKRSPKKIKCASITILETNKTIVLNRNYTKKEILAFINKIKKIPATPVYPVEGDLYYIKGTIWYKDGSWSVRVLEHDTYMESWKNIKRPKYPDQ